jgi:hypothetical protein
MADRIKLRPEDDTLMLASLIISQLLIGWPARPVRALTNRARGSLASLRLTEDERPL